MRFLANRIWRPLLVVLLTFGPACAAIAAESAHHSAFPPALDSYPAPEGASIPEILRLRILAEPFNLVASIIFFLAIIHTFLAPKFMRMAHRFEHEHRARLAAAGQTTTLPGRGQVSFKAEVFHFFGEVEAVFGIWIIPLLLCFAFYKGWPSARDYLGHDLRFAEPVFVVVIMTIAASRPILSVAEKLMAIVANIGGGSIAAWWFSILTVGPILGSFITEPAAMTISAMLLGKKVYERRPKPTFAYATLGLLFVNVSVGGTLTPVAAPPVLMVAGKWGWDLAHMLMNFGWKAVLGILLANSLYLVLFRNELRRLSATAPQNRAAEAETTRDPVPAWVSVVHILFLGWTVLNNHFPPLFVGGFLFYLAFTRATEHHQNDLALRPALLVGFFLAGLVVHGGLQGWWIGPMLRGLNEVPLFLGATLLTAFNDNAAITYLASLVPDFSPPLQHAVVAGAVTGGGLTVIANAPNPAGQSVLAKFFPDGVSPLGLFLGAITPTIILALIFLAFR